MLWKDCPICGTRLPTTDFHLNASQRDGYCTACIDCTRARRRRYGRGLDPTRLFQECRTCGDVLSLDQFDRHNSTLTGFTDRCTSCRRAAWYEFSCEAVA